MALFQVFPLKSVQMSIPISRLSLGERAKGHYNEFRITDFVKCVMPQWSQSQGKAGKGIGCASIFGRFECQCAGGEG